MEALKKKILNLMECVYQHNYISRIEVNHNGEAYILKLYLQNRDWGPLVIANQCETDDEFLCFVEKELRTRNLIRSEHYKIQLHANN